MSSVLTPMRTIHVPSMLASMTRRRSGNDLVVALDKHGYAPSRTTSNIRTWGCGRPGTELMTAICDVISWKRRRSCSSMLHDDDDDDDVVNRRVLFQKSSVSSMLRRPSKRDGQPSWSRIKNKNNKQE